MGILPLVAGSPTPKLGKSVTPLLLGRRSHRFREYPISLFLLFWFDSMVSLLNSGSIVSSTWKTSKCDWEQHGHSCPRGIGARRSRKVSASRESNISNSREHLDPRWFGCWEQCCKRISSSAQSLPIPSFASKQVGTSAFIWDSISLFTSRPLRFLEEAMALSSCSNGSLEPLDSDGLVAHNDQVKYLPFFVVNVKGVKLNSSFPGATADGGDFLATQSWGLKRISPNISCSLVLFSCSLVVGRSANSLLCQVTQLRRDLTLSRLALQQVVS